MLSIGFGGFWAVGKEGLSGMVGIDDMTLDVEAAEGFSGNMGRDQVTTIGAFHPGFVIYCRLL